MSKNTAQLFSLLAPASLVIHPALPFECRRRI